MIKIWRIALITATVPFIANDASATMIVAIRTDDSFVIAADSQRTFQAHEGRPPIAVCKVFSANGAIFAMSGWQSHRSEGLDGEAIVAEALSQRPSILSAAAVLENRLSRAYTSWLARVSRDPAFIRETLRPDDYPESMIAEVVLGGFDHTSVAFAIGIHVVDGLSRTARAVIRWRCMTSCQDNVYVMGSPKMIAPGPADPMPPTVAPEAFASSLVQNEIRTGNPSVGAPIDVAKATKSGVSWHPRQAMCTDSPSK
jgi:hypothetical protein